VRFSKSARRTLRAASLVLAGGLLACDGERLRPGPPELVLTGPESGTVFSPDTIVIAVRAVDANGMDSVAVTVLGQSASTRAFAEVVLEDLLLFVIPAGLTVGDPVTFTGVAVDLAGQTTTQTLVLTVAARP